MRKERQVLMFSATWPEVPPATRAPRATRARGATSVATSCNLCCNVWLPGHFELLQFSNSRDVRSAQFSIDVWFFEIH